MERQYAHRVACPTCGRWAQVRVTYRESWPPRVVAFSCPDQTDARHAVPTRDEIVRLIPTDVVLPDLDRYGHLPW